MKKMITSMAAKRKRNITSMAAKRKRKRTNSSSFVSDLPSSLMVEILIKLPIKSIVRSRCVCKTWKSLISEKYFTTLYFKNPPNPQSELVLKYNYNTKCLCFAEIGLNGEDTLLTKINLPNLKSGDLILKCSCNGLLCFVHKNHFSNHYCENDVVCIMNPILGEFKMLPKAHRIYEDDPTYVFYGFSQCTKTNHYKVLGIVKPKEKDIVFEIFTIGVDHDWRFIKNSYNIDFCVSTPDGITHEGVIYFTCHDSDRTLRIFAFDLEREKGRLIFLPYQFKYLDLFLHDGHLGLFDTNDNKVILWTMKQCGSLESWSRQVELEIPHDVLPKQLLPITKLIDGDLLMSSYIKGLISYNGKTKKFRKLIDSAYDFYFIYVPNFLPLSTYIRPEDCESQMVGPINSSNALGILEISDSFSNHLLKETAINFIIKNIDDVFFSDKFDAFVRKNPDLTVQITRALLKATRSLSSITTVHF